VVVICGGQFVVFVFEPVGVAFEGEDVGAAAEAKRRGSSKSELIRRGLAAVLPGPEGSGSHDLWIELAGFGSAGVSLEPGEIDRILYGG
jgi:hypothetical protein